MLSAARTFTALAVAILMVASLPFALAASEGIGAPAPVEQLQVSPTAEVVAMINASRQQAGLAPLAVHPALEAAAGSHSVDLAAEGSCLHEGSDGSTPEQRMRAAGYGTPLGEIVSCGQASATRAVEAWLASDLHRALVECTDCAEFGVGYDASTGGFRHYWTVNFGRPAVIGSAPLSLVRRVRLP